MKITKDKVVSIEYTLKDADGTVLDTSEGVGPLEYLHGHGNLIPGLEKELEGKTAGDSLTVTVEPADGYGEYNEEMVVEVPKAQFEAGTEIEVGMQFEAASSAGNQIVTIVKVTDDKVTIDANHELAGETLYFDVKINEVRDASADELANGLDDGCGCGCGGSCGDDCGGGCGDNDCGGSCGCH
mgnify:CR=1 FL=1